MNFLYTNNLDLEKCDLNTVIDSSFIFLKLKAHKYGHIFHYINIPVEKDKRKISDIIDLAYKFYNSKVHIDYLVTLQLDDIKKNASKIYKKKGFVLWKDLIGYCKFKELCTDCCRENAIELILDYNINDF
jgi:hypothetical protein